MRHDIFFECFKNHHIENYNHILVAVSGGSDSVGLLHALYCYCKKLPHAPRLSVITVDHDLRKESAQEADFVTHLCARLNITHVIRKWHGIKPSSGIQNAARDMRRKLIAYYAGDINADVIVTGHTLDDQIETIIMRQRRNSNLGLSGIAPASVIFDDDHNGQPFWVLRPFLNITRAKIRNYLTHKTLSWMEDSSNSNPAFERVAIRTELQTMSEEMQRVVLELGTNTSRHRYRLSIKAATLLQNFVQEVAPMLFKIDHNAFVSYDPHAGLHLLRALIAFAGGAAHFADIDIAQQIIKQSYILQSAQNAKPWRTTSHGALCDVRKTGVFLLKEARLQRSRRTEFNRHYRILGKKTTMPTTSEFPINKAPLSLLRQAERMEPRYIADEISAFDALQKGYALRRCPNPWPDVIPLFDFELANKLSEMNHCAELPRFKSEACVFF
jgi:tRNA(Ile)-lysidine synthase